MRKCALIVALGVSAVLGCQAANVLEWEKPLVEAEAGTSEKSIPVEFHFRNPLDRAIHIRKVSTSCGCSVAKLANQQYEAGANGVLQLTLALKGKRGVFEEKILVQTSERDEPDVLTLRVKVPELVKIDQDMLSWQTGEIASPKSFAIEIVQPETAKVLSVRSLGSSFSAELKEIEPARRYSVSVVPSTAEHPVKGTIRLEVADPVKRAIYLRVQVSDQREAQVTSNQ